MKIIFSVLGILLTLALIPVTVSAHGLATTKSELIGNYLLHLEYDTLGNISAGETTSFSFEILDPNTQESADFDRVFVRIVKKNGPIAFVSNLFPMEEFAVKSARASIFIPDEGDYDIQVNYYKGENKLAEHTFTLPVDPPNNFNGSQASNSAGLKKYIWIAALIAGVIIGMGTAKMIKSKK